VSQSIKDLNLNLHCFVKHKNLAAYPYILWDKVKQFELGTVKCFFVTKDVILDVTVTLMM